MFELVAAILLFAFSSTITPGPNNIMIMSSGLNYGIRASLPHLVGICLGFPLMVLLIGMGFGVVFEQWPWMHQLIKVVGLAYLLYLAWKIASASTSAIELSKGKPFSFVQAALFQWVNPKAWVMASSAVAAFTHASGAMLPQVVLIAAMFFAVAFPCVGLWLVFGMALKRWFQDPARQRWFNRSMALLLVLSMWPVVQEVLQRHF